MDENGKPENAADGVVLIYATFPGDEDAACAGRGLVEQGLAACVNIIPGMRSIYRWQGFVEEADEVVMIAKTQRRLADAVMAYIRAGHAYQNPALLVLPVESGAPDFLGWLRAETTPVANVTPAPARTPTSAPEDG